MTASQVLDFYTQPAAMTYDRGDQALFEGMPRDVASLCRVVHGLLLHEHWAPAYGIVLSDERRCESHIRPVKRMLERLLAHDNQPLSASRPLDARLVCVCRHFAVLLVAMLRAQGVPARARCGFGTYFNPGYFEDHWVCEYWNAAEARWILVDAQIDEFQKEKLKLDFDPLDVPRDRFIVAGDAWIGCRNGDADPLRFGIFDMRGLWFVAANLMRDLAALNNMEMLPWDVWSPMSEPDDPLQNDQLSLFDQLAGLTHAPDASFAELRSFYEGDGRLRVPQAVFNAVRNRLETV